MSEMEVLCSMAGQLVVDFVKSKRRMIERLDGMTVDSPSDFADEQWNDLKLVMEQKATLESAIARIQDEKN